MLKLTGVSGSSSTSESVYPVTPPRLLLQLEECILYSRADYSGDLSPPAVTRTSKSLRRLVHCRRKNVVQMCQGQVRLILFLIW